MTKAKVHIKSPSGDVVGEMKLTEDLEGRDIKFYDLDGQKTWMNGATIVFVMHDRSGLYNVTCMNFTEFIRNFDAVGMKNYWTMSWTGIQTLRTKTRRVVLFEGARVGTAFTDPLGLYMDGTVDWSSDLDPAVRFAWASGNLKAVMPQNRYGIIKLERIEHHDVKGESITGPVCADISIYNLPIIRFDEIRTQLFDLLGAELNVRFHNDESEFDDE